MGMYLNPGLKGFETIRNGVYVDKTGLIDYVNSTINTPQKLTCFSRPRRFGKSFAAKMLCAYYDNSCDARELFKDLEIAKKKSFEEHLNRYDVIYLDITRFISTAPSVDEIVACIQSEVITELAMKYPSCVSRDEKVLANALFAVSHKTQQRFIVIIDEWDALFREAKNDQNIQKAYVQLLRGLFKGGTTTDETIAAAYMTGILPIKKYGTQSALTDFQEYTMTSPAKLAKYVGFTEAETRRLCRKYHMNFENMQTWYDGYSFLKIDHVYNPNSVIKALRNEEIQNYWTQTETFESLKKYISMDFDGLQQAIVEMLGGKHVAVKISTFQNDMTSFDDKNDVLTLLIHLGYLAYDSLKKEVYIPNLEVMEAFEDAVSSSECFADLAFIPRRNVDKPAMIVELKYNRDADSAIRQIHENRYDGALKEYQEEMLLVGINYDRDAKGAEAKRHSCVIERI